MDEDNIPQTTQESPDAENEALSSPPGSESDAGTEENSERVFEISPDFNILPVENIPLEKKVQKPATPSYAPKPTPMVRTDQQPNIVPPVAPKIINQLETDQPTPAISVPPRPAPQAPANLPTELNAGGRNLPPASEVFHFNKDAPSTPIKPASSPIQNPPAPKPPVIMSGMPAATLPVKPSLNKPISTFPATTPGVKSMPRFINLMKTNETPVSPIRPRNPGLSPSTGAPGASPALTDPNMKPLRTYESDVADLMAQNKFSKATIAIAENRKKEGTDSIANNAEEQPSSHSGKKLLLLLLSLILIGGGVVGAYYLYSLSPLALKQPAAVSEQTAAVSLIPADSQAVLHIDGLSPTEIQSRIQQEASKPQPPDTVKEIILVQKQARVTGPQMVSLMDIGAPDILVRSLTPAWMLGVYSDDSGATSVFVTVTTNFFQNAFAGMLQWESVMADDIKQYLYPADYPSAPLGIANVGPIASSTIVQAFNPLTDLNSILPPASTTTIATSSVPKKAATSTASSASSMSEAGGGALKAPQKNVPPSATNASSLNVAAAATTSAQYTASNPIQPYFTIRGHFEDRIIMNKDVRAFVAEDGRVLFLYSFIDNTKLTVTNSQAALSEILTRLEKQAFIR